MTDNPNLSPEPAPEIPADMTPGPNPEPNFLVVHPGTTNKDGFLVVCVEDSDGSYRPARATGL